MIAQIITSWVTNEEGENIPRILIDYPIPQILRYVDVTNQPTGNIAPLPNLFVAQVECDAVVLAAIEADANYLVLWSE